MFKLINYVISIPDLRVNNKKFSYSKYIILLINFFPKSS